MIYRLNASTTDRMSFDEMCFQCGWDAAADFRDQNLTPEDIAGLAQSALDVAEQAEQLGEINETTEIMEMYEYDNYHMTVDDIDEARARWLSAWANGFEARHGTTSK